MTWPEDPLHEVIKRILPNETDTEYMIHFFASHTFYAFLFKGHISILNSLPHSKFQVCAEGKNYNYFFT